MPIFSLVCRFDDRGKIQWTRDLGPGVVPGIWFCPIFSFDLDQDGTDEIYYVGNAYPTHPLDFRKYQLVRLDARNGKTTGTWPWPTRFTTNSMSHTTYDRLCIQPILSGRLLDHGRSFFEISGIDPACLELFAPHIAFIEALFSAHIGLIVRDGKEDVGPIGFRSRRTFYDRH